MRPHSHRPTTIALTVLGLLAMVCGVQLAAATPSAAADAADFDPGFLISDAAFFNGTAMSAKQIDDFIDDRNPGCLQAVCLTNYKENVTAKAATTRCTAIKAASSQSAGQIIATVARSCGISPKAILVILQKEQSLVTSRTPSARSFAYAMGAGCPDSTGCNTPYQGLYQQVYYGASLLKSYTLPSSSHYTRYQAGKTSQILYDTTAGCGTRAVFVRNQATHALYVYTPYTPNKAALKNLYGTGDACSAYGNRNFWRMYIDWFGPTGVIGETEITEFWNSKGGETGTIGTPTGSPVLNTARGGGYYQGFTNGSVAWTQQYGARYLKPTFASLWIKTGIGTMGWPQQSTYTSTTFGGGLIQKFMTGMLVQPNGRSAFYMTSGLRNAWETYGGPSGVLGWPHDVKYLVRPGLWAMDFDKGTVVHNGSRFAWVHSSFAEDYLALGDVTSALGWPTGNYTADSMRNGVGWQRFTNGKMFESTKYGVHEVTGTIYNAYAKLGGRVAIGWPTSEPYTDPVSGLLRQDFEDASILTDGKAAYVVAAPLVDEAVKRGLFGGSLGAPTGTPLWSKANGGGVVQDFKGGTLAYGPSGEVAYVYGGLLTAWNAKGRESGVLGWPTSNRYNDDAVGTIDQDFQFGTVFHNRVKWGTVGVNFVSIARDFGVTTSPLGWATSNTVKVSKNGGGQYQSFKGGTLTWHAGANFYVPSSVWTTVRSHGGVSGSTVGWPTAAATWDAKKATWVQKFQFATITCVTGKACTVKAAS